MINHSPTASMTAAVIVSSDRASGAQYDDLSGPAAAKWLGAAGFEVLSRTIVADDSVQLVEALSKALDLRVPLVVVSGGTGLGSRDVTPQTLDTFGDYHIPGIGELLRRESLKYSLNAYLSRCGGWVKDRTLILAVPGNPKAVVEQLDILGDLLPHAIKSLGNACEHRRSVAESHA